MKLSSIVTVVALAVIAAGCAHAPKKSEVAETYAAPAAWTTVANVLLNLDETLMKR